MGSADFGLFWRIVPPDVLCVAVGMCCAIGEGMTNTITLPKYTGTEVRRWLASLNVYNPDTGRRACLPRKIGRGLLVDIPAPCRAAWHVICVDRDTYTIETLA